MPSASFNRNFPVFSIKDKLGANLTQNTAFFVDFIFLVIESMFLFSSNVQNKIFVIIPFLK